MQNTNEQCGAAPAVNAQVRRHLTRKKNTNDRFEPEADGKGRVDCPADHKAMRQATKKPHNQSMRDALITALGK